MSLQSLGKNLQQATEMRYLKMYVLLYVKYIMMNYHIDVLVQKYNRTLSYYR